MMMAGEPILLLSGPHCTLCRVQKILLQWIRSGLVANLAHILLPRSLEGPGFCDLMLSFL